MRARNLKLRRAVKRLAVMRMARKLAVMMKRMARKLAVTQRKLVAMQRKTAVMTMRKLVMQSQVEINLSILAGVYYIFCPKFFSQQQ